MTKLAELAVTSHRPTLRSTAGQTFLTFLLHYPLGDKRLQFHLNQVRNECQKVTDMIDLRAGSVHIHIAVGLWFKHSVCIRDVMYSE